MSKKISWLLVAVTLFAVLAGTNGYGQSSTRVKGNIPFDFRVGSQSLPAGEYTVVPKSPVLVVIQSKDGHQSALVMTNAIQARRISTDGKLVFNRYGAFYFLAQVWTPGEEVGRVLPKSKAEQEVAGGIQPTETTILIAKRTKK